MITYTERFVRFGAAAVSIGILLVLLALPGGWPLPPLGGDAAAKILHAIEVTGQYLGIGLLYALPVALLLGVPAGLTAGGRFSRALTMPLALVAGIPIPVLAMLLFAPLSLHRDLLDMAGVARVVVATVAVAWI
ncbi:MAG TPA: hypothetical protein VD973_13980, partial [Symbiobacteriaceae bacterium]|nr:hypothetical protein [Symbiobacteriaceae bacterium]